MTAAKRCDYCGERVYTKNGWFRSWPDPVNLHHGCVKPWHRQQKLSGKGVTIGKTQP